MSWDLVDFHISDTSGDHKCLFFAKQHFPNWESVPVQVWTGNKCETLDSEQTGSNYGSWCRWLQQSISPVWHNLGSKQGKLQPKTFFYLKLKYVIADWPKTPLLASFYKTTQPESSRVGWTELIAFLGAKPKLYGPVFFQRDYIYIYCFFGSKT